MIDQWELTIPELSGDFKRRAYVYVPDSFRQNPGKRYPVFYMFDGHNVFYDSHATYGKSWGMKEYLEKSGMEIIVAAVECNSVGQNRMHEYSPYRAPFHTELYLEGRGGQYMDWLCNTFKPYVDSHYPTLPDREHTGIGGSSMGGIMTIFAVTEYNHVFSKGAALSPCIWIKPDELYRQIAQDNILPDTHLYMSFGEKEIWKEEDRRFFTDLAVRYWARGVDAMARLVPGGTHCEACWEKEIPVFLNAIRMDKIE